MNLEKAEFGKLNYYFVVMKIQFRFFSFCFSENNIEVTGIMNNDNLSDIGKETS